MLRTLLYNLLMGIYKFVVGVEVVDTVVELEDKGKVGKAVLKVQSFGERILEIALKLAYISFMITITGGLYLFWLGFKLMRKNKRKRIKTHKRS